VVVQRSRQRHEKCYMTFFGDSGVAAEHCGGGWGTDRHGLQHRRHVSRRAGFRRTPRGGHLL